MPGLDELSDDLKRNTRGRFEQWVKNPKCDANTISAVLNVRLSAVAEKLSYEPNYAQSPFAIQRGNAFEKSLFYDDARELVTALTKAAAISTEDTKFIDFRLRLNGGSRVNSVDEALAESVKFLKALPESDQRDTLVVAALTIRIPKGVMLPEATLVIDALTAVKDDVGWLLTVGEVKVFPDRGGHTDPAEIATARAQAGVYVHALDLALQTLKISQQIRINRRGFLVFTKPGTNRPIVRADEDLTYQAIRADTGFDRLDAIAQALLAEGIPAESTDQLLEFVAHSKTHFEDSCWAFCDLAARCFDIALADDSPMVLGRDSAAHLGGITVTRAVELLNGADPEDEMESTLQVLMRNSDWHMP